MKFALLVSFVCANPNILLYKDGLFVGAGIENSDASVMGSPFEPSSINMKNEELSMQGRIAMDIV
jgi:hypothetical protein